MEPKSQWTSQRRFRLADRGLAHRRRRLLLHPRRRHRLLLLQTSQKKYGVEELGRRRRRWRRRKRRGVVKRQWTKWSFVSAGPWISTSSTGLFPRATATAITRRVRAGRSFCSPQFPASRSRRTLPFPTTATSWISKRSTTLGATSGFSGWRTDGAWINAKIQTREENK